MSTRIERIKDAIDLRYNCRAEHVRSVPVVEKSDGKTVWEGVVEVFDLIGNHEAERCYAWAVRRDGVEQQVIVLQQPPVISAQTAVRAAIARDRKK